MNRLLLTPLLLLALASTALADEAALIAVLQSDAPAPEKASACVSLRIEGTAASVPTLAALLADPRLGHPARYALEAMPYPEADAALRNALTRTQGDAKAGIIDSLGQRRDTTAVNALTHLLADKHTSIAASAAHALGRIGGDEAMNALQNAAPTIQSAAQEALLDCAKHYEESTYNNSAATVYKKLNDTAASTPIRQAAFTGWLRNAPAAREEAILAILSEKNSHLTQPALQLLRNSPGPTLAKAALARWDDLSPMAQLAALDANITHSDAPLPAIQRAAASDNASIRAAAWQAVADTGTVSMLSPLLDAAAQGDSLEQDAARDALARLRGASVDAELRAELGGETARSIEAMRALGARGNPDSAQPLLAAAGNADAPVQIAALKALRELGAPETLAPLIGLAARSSETNVRNAALAAVVDTYERHPDPRLASKTAANAIDQLSPESQAAVFPLLSRFATNDALQVALAALESDNATLKDAAILALSRWPNHEPSVNLMAQADLVGGGPLGSRLYRAALTTARLAPTPKQRLSLMNRSVSYPHTEEDVRYALDAYKSVTSPDGLRHALMHLGVPEFREVAATTALTIAEALADNEPQLANEAATQVLAMVDEASLVARAWALRAQPAGDIPFLRQWLVTGPYHKAGGSGAMAFYDTQFPPEVTGAPVDWYSTPEGDTVNLAAFFPGHEDCAAYLKTEITLPAPADAMLLIGSDDGVKAWLNGKLVHGNNVDRGQIADQDRASIQLQAGANTLMLKITQGGGGWSACARIVGMDGRALDGLQVMAQADGAPPVSEWKPDAPGTPVDPITPPRVPFRTLKLSGDFYAEGAYYGDFNKDGDMDIVAGPFWFAGPDFSDRHEYRPAKTFDPLNYSDNFLTYSGDFNQDGWTDILCMPFPGVQGYWYANPGSSGGPWTEYPTHEYVGNESPMTADLDGDGRLEMLFCAEGYLGYAMPDPAAPEKPWTFHPISGQDPRYQRFTHGLGVGDIDGDGRSDVIESAGWWSQPEALPGAWTFHPQRFAEAGAQMLVYDFDGDGLADIASAWHCHQYGISWWQQRVNAAGARTWQQHEILSPTPDLASPDFRVSQMHGAELADMNGDGLLDILTGKRFWAHGPEGDKEPSAPALLFYFELQRGPDRTVTFTPRLIHDDSGVGTQVTAVDLNKDTKPDVVVANKKGIFVHLSE